MIAQAVEAGRVRAGWEPGKRALRAELAVGDWLALLAEAGASPDVRRHPTRAEVLVRTRLGDVECDVECTVDPERSPGSFRVWAPPEWQHPAATDRAPDRAE